VSELAISARREFVVRQLAKIANAVGDQRYAQIYDYPVRTKPTGAAAGELWCDERVGATRVKVTGGEPRDPTSSAHAPGTAAAQLLAIYDP